MYVGATFQAPISEKSIFFKLPKNDTLRFVCEQAGADKVLMGTDAPFTIAEPEPVQFVDAAKFGTADRAAIMGGTAAKLFRIGA